MLFASLYRWLFSRRLPNRAIFHYWDGQRNRAADPSILVRLIENDEELNLEIDGALIENGEGEIYHAAVGRAVRCVHRAFGVKDFEHGGLLEAECLVLLESFLGFIDSLKKNISPSPIESPPTESDTSIPSTGPAPIPSMSSSDSISMPNVPS